MRQFVEDIGIDDMIYEMPGDDGDWDINLRNMVAAQPEDEEFNTDAPATTHLVIRLNSFENFTADEDGDVPEFEEFVDLMLEFEKDDAPAHIETIRQNLAAGAMHPRCPRPLKKELMKLTDLDKWHVKEDRGGLEFDWTADDGQPLHPYTGDVKWDDMRAQMWDWHRQYNGCKSDAEKKSAWLEEGTILLICRAPTNIQTSSRENCLVITAHLKSKPKHRDNRN